MSFCDMLIPDRVRLISETHDLNNLYEVLEKHLNIDIDKLKEMYKFRGDFVQNSLFISGNCDDIYNLFIHLNRFGLKFEHSLPHELRVDLYTFIKTII